MAKNALTVSRNAGNRAMGKAQASHTDIAILEFQSPTAALIALPVPWTSRATIWAITSLVLINVAVLAVVKVDRVVVAPGKLQSVVPDFVVQPLETSIVRSINVTEGQIVHKGDLIARLDPTFAEGDDKSTTAQQDSLAAEVARLRAELASQTYASDGSTYGQMQEMMFQQRQDQYQFHMQNYAQKIASLKSKVDQAEAAIESAQARLPGLESVEAKRRELERLQVGSQLNTLSAADATLQMRAQLADSLNVKIGAQRDLSAMIAEAQDYVHQTRTDTFQQLTTQERLLSDMRGQATKNQLRHSLVELRAPQDSIVLSIARVSRGTVLQGGDELARLVPIDSPLEIAASVPATESGFVHVGDTVSIKFNTLPYQHYGFAKGVVMTMSPDSFIQPSQQSQITHPDIAANSASNLPDDPVFYRARISISELQLRNLPAGFRLVPGMPITDDIKVGSRTILEYMLSRIVPAATEGMREP